jgi:hypothetical protein
VPTANHDPSPRFNAEAFMEGMFKKAEAVAEETIQYTLKRAQKHAPVRKIFKGTRYKNSKLMGGYASPAGVAKVPITSRIRTPNLGDSGENVGHANSLEPVFNIRASTSGNHRSERTRITGDFRRVQMGDGLRTHALADGSVVHHAAFGLEKVPYERMKIDKGGKLVEDTPKKGTVADATPRLSSAGRFELKTGRANFKDPHTDVVRVGGRLRGSLYVEGPEREGDMVWANVVSPVKYSRHMEFGTSHNRPYPYLRPALQESRTVFKRNARRVFKSDVQSLGMQDQTRG